MQQLRILSKQPQEMAVLVLRGGKRILAHLPGRGLYTFPDTLPTPELVAMSQKPHTGISFKIETTSQEASDV